MNKSDLVQALIANLHLSRQQAVDIVDALFESIIEALAEGKTIQLRGFGTFQAKKRTARSGRNPRTGQTIAVPPKTAVSFVAGKNLKSAVSEGAGGGRSPRRRAAKKRKASAPRTDLRERRARASRPGAPKGGGSARYLPYPYRENDAPPAGAAPPREEAMEAAPSDAASPEAVPPAGERVLQARVETPVESGQDVVRRLLPEKNYALCVFIGGRRSDWLGLGEPLDEPPPRPDGRPNKLRVVFWEPDACPEPQVQELDLWPTGDTDTCRFEFHTPAGARHFSARIAVYFGNRNLQVGRLTGGVGGGAELAFRLDAVPLPRFVDQEGRAPVGASVVLDADSAGEPLLCVFHDGEADVAAAGGGAPAGGEQPAPIDVEVGEESSLQKLNDAIGRCITKITQKPDNYTGLEKEGTRELLCDLAQRGAIFLDHLKHHTRLRDALDKAQYIQIVQAHADAFFPLEFLYDGLPPESSAPICDGAADAAAARGALTRGACCGACDADPENTVCPLKFWSLNRVIERHAHIPEHSDISGQLQLRRAGPSAQRPSLSPLSSVVFATSDRVDSARSGTVAHLATRLGQLAGRAPVVQAADWDELADKVKQVRPHLLVLLPHHENRQGDDYLEIGGVERKLILVRERHVRAPGDEELAPVVLMIGCETNSARINFENCVLRYQKHGASIIVSTLASILGREAGPAAEAIVEQLTLVEGAEATFGAAMLAARRKLMVEGLPMVLGLTSYGDADWLIRREGGSAAAAPSATPSNEP
ncbi:MAG: hypothetical protein Tsb0032_13310 [Kiloniellaceae bacterium]